MCIQKIIDLSKLAFSPVLWESSDHRSNTEGSDGGGDDERGEGCGRVELIGQVERDTAVR